jgi:hypothetical protein
MIIAQWDADSAAGPAESGKHRGFARTGVHQFSLVTEGFIAALNVRGGIKQQFGNRRLKDAASVADTNDNPVTHFCRRQYGAGFDTDDAGLREAERRSGKDVWRRAGRVLQQR